jgi:hypothetical protein
MGISEGSLLSVEIRVTGKPNEKTGKVLILKGTCYLPLERANRLETDFTYTSILLSLKYGLQDC